MSIAHEYSVIPGKGPRFASSAVVTVKLGVLQSVHILALKAVRVGMITFG